MSLIVLKSGDALSYTKNRPPKLTELPAIEDLLLDEQITLQDMYTLLFMYSKDDYEEKEEVLLIIDRFCQFMVEECDLNKIYMLAFYIDTIITLKSARIEKDLNNDFFSFLTNDSLECDTQNEYNEEERLRKLKKMLFVFDKIIKTLQDNAEIQKYNKKINEILKNDVQNGYFNSLKGFYLLISESIEKSQFVFSQDKNSISDIGDQYIKNIRNNNHNKELWQKYTSNNICPENLILFIDSFTKMLNQTKHEAIKDLNIKTFITNINEIKAFYKKIDTNVINFYIGKVYHLEKDYTNASIYYSQSNLQNAIYNQMNITRKVIDDNEIYNPILNYIYLCTNKPDKISLNSTNDKNYQIYKTKQDEKWCGSALTSYTNLLLVNVIEKHVIWNNIAFYFMECLNEDEMDIIEVFYDLLRKLKINNDNTNKYLIIQNETYKSGNKHINEIIQYCKKVIANNLSSFKDPISLYNLSFLLSKEEAIKVLQKIQNLHAQIRLAFLTNDKNRLESLKHQNLNIYNFYSNFYLLKNKKLQSFVYNKAENVSLNVFASIFELYLQVNNYFTDKNESTLLKAKKFCTSLIAENRKCFYLVFYYAYINYTEKNYTVAIKTLEFFLKETKMCKNVNVKKIQNKSYLLLALCHLNLGNIDTGIYYLKNVDHMQEAKSLLRTLQHK